MKAKKCDRCSSFFDGEKIELPESYAVKRRSKTASRYEKTLDLCPKCTEELGTWMKEGAKHGK